MNINIKPIQSFDDPDRAFFEYKTLLTKLTAMENHGLLNSVLWEVNLSVGTLQGCVVTTNIIKKPKDNG